MSINPAESDVAAGLLLAVVPLISPQEVERLAGLRARAGALSARQLLGVDEETFAGADLMLRAKRTLDEDLQLVRAAAAGDEEACRQLVRLYTGAIKGMLIGKGLINDMDDLLQEILVKVFSGLHSYLGLASLKTWILRIAENHIKNHLRNRHSRVMHEILEADLSDDDMSKTKQAPGREPTPSETYHVQERRRAALRIFQQIDQQYRMPIVLTQLGGCSYEEAARVLGIAEGTVKSRISRGRNMLAEQIRAVGFE